MVPAVVVCLQVVEYVGEPDGLADGTAVGETDFTEGTADGRTVGVVGLADGLALGAVGANEGKIVGELVGAGQYARVVLFPLQPGEPTQSVLLVA